MIETAPNETQLTETPSCEISSSEIASSESLALQDCQALMLCLDSGRFVIVRIEVDAGPSVTCIEKPDLRDLAAGDVVTYRGRDCKVQAVEIYR